MKKIITTQPIDINDVNRNIIECWQLIKLANERRKQQKEYRQHKNKS